MDSTDNIFNEKLVLIDLDANDWVDTIRALGSTLYENGYVKDTFVDAVIEREKTMATGLPTKPLGVAMPHTDFEHVNQTGIAVGILSSPVLFKQMGAPDLEVQASLVFLLAIKEPEQQVPMLQGLVQLFRRPEILGKLKGAAHAKDIVAVFKQEIGEKESQIQTNHMEENQLEK